MANMTTLAIVEPIAPLHYRVVAASLSRHRWAVELNISRPQAEQIVSLPVWVPGSYLIREFARHLHRLQASQEDEPCLLEQLDKTRWKIRADPKKTLTLTYEVYAFDNSVRTSWLDQERGFFNGTSLFLRVHGQEEHMHALTLVEPQDVAHWRVATAMPSTHVNAAGFGDYAAGNYDELIDHPVEMGDFWSGDFEIRGVPYRFVVAGAPASFDGQRLLHDTRQLCEATVQLWHPDGEAPPQRQYVFMLNAVGHGYGGLEHRESTALICSRSDLPTLGMPARAECSKNYVNLLGLISHEHFHTWNIKRLKPSEFEPYDLERENYTRLLWFFEGITSYYDDLLLHRAGLISAKAYLKIISKTINSIMQAPGRKAQSVAQASFDAWTRFYRPDENTPNTTISYYGKGALVGLCLDLLLRAEGKGSLDDAMRALWANCKGGPVTEDDIADALKQVGGRSFIPELQAWVHDTQELPLKPLLGNQGVKVIEDKAPLAQSLGLRVHLKNTRLFIQLVLDDSPAATAGLSAGDEWVGLEVPASGQPHKTRSWRINQLDDIKLFAGKHKNVKALVARDQKLLSLPLELPPPAQTWHLSAASAHPQGDWLDFEHPRCA